MHRYITEMIGTFFLVATMGLVIANPVPLGPLAIGSVLMVMVYMGSHISGAHFNPAVSLAIWLRGRLNPSELIPYFLSQTGGGLIGAIAVTALTRHSVGVGPAEDAGSIAPLAVEVLFTFALALVVLNVATDKATQGNSFYGAAIGFTVMVGFLAGGPISGGVFNPAVGIALVVNNVLHGGGNLGSLWLYLIGPTAGAVLAAVVYRVQHPATA